MPVPALKSNSSRLPTRNSNLIEQKTLNSNIPIETGLPPFGNEDALNVGSDERDRSR
jgi:hypothetical protein